MGTSPQKAKPGSLHGLPGFHFVDSAKNATSGGRLDRRGRGLCRPHEVLGQRGALVAALDAKKIAGAALDVYENEPFIHPGLKRPNVVLTPHLASASLETRTKMAVMAANGVVALFKGQQPANMLNPDVLKKN